MEYEIQDQGEDVLFDESTNPSLKQDEEAPVRDRKSQTPQADKRKVQTAELIPEEEEQQLA